MKIQIDNIETVVKDKSLGKEHLSWPKLLTILLQAMGSVGEEPSMEALIEFFGLGKIVTDSDDDLDGDEEELV